MPTTDELQLRLGWIRERLIVIDRELAAARRGDAGTPITANRLSAFAKERARLATEAARLADQIGRD
jgi:hypothetical protein